MTLDATGTCSGCGQPDADLLVFNNYGQFCVDCDIKKIAYQTHVPLTPSPPTTYIKDARVKDGLRALQAITDEQTLEDLAKSDPTRNEWLDEKKVYIDIDPVEETEAAIEAGILDFGEPV